MNELLTDEQLIEVTGAVQAAKQADVLDRHGIFYIKKAGGTKICTTWYHINHPNMHRTVANDEMPNFEAIQ